MKKTALVIMIITVVSKALGFGREILLSYFYGASAVTDAYLVSLTIPGVIFSFIGVGIGTGFIPMFSRVKQRQGSEAAIRFTNNLTNVILVFCTTVLLGGVIFTKPIVRILASGFSGEILELTIRFTRISIFSIYFTSLIGIFSGYLRLSNSYLVPNLVGLPMNITIILSVLISSRTSVYVLLAGTLLARVAEFLFMVPFARRKGYRFLPVFDIRDDNLKAMVHIAMPVIFGTSINQVNKLVDRTLASGIAVGGISALNYAARLNGFVHGLFVMSISTVMYPMISKMASEQNLRGLKNTLSEAIAMINIMVIPATVGAIIFAEPIVDLLFGRGAFTPEAAAMSSSALRFYSIGMLAFGLREILSRAFYALQDTKTPMVNGAIAVGLNIVLNIILSRYLGIGGLALATSIAAIVATVLLLVTLRRKIGGFRLREITFSLGKMTIASVVMGIIASVAYGNLCKALSANLSLILAIGVGALTYLIIIYILRVPEVHRPLDAVKQILKKHSCNE
jgi:putative peptidoglycan lipid II flippase